ncbi:MAG: protein-L-isoaspartate(D-aspartate) O-methyltransferase [Candidatus Azambacteria bacterium]|nr:protein-L-isoaspartate(D-aspartate) O-methyltransferase [Candidatus Azambacteria bacterium]
MINPFVLDFMKQGVLKNPEIINAFKRIDRADFVSPESKEEAYINAPLPIGEGQTISQPLTVAFMIELLQPKAGDKIFEIGFGSGWQTAILAEIVGKFGKIFAVERIPGLFRFGRKNIAKYGFIKNGIVKAIGGDATLGLKRHAPFDRIIAAASGKEVPEEWLKELKTGGRLVAPIKNSIWLYIKKSSKEFEKKEFPGFVFVPLIIDKK